MPTIRPAVFLAACTSLALVVSSPVHAEKADRFKPINILAGDAGKIDMLNQTTVFGGGVTVTKGTMTIRADHIEVRESPDGYRVAVAIGSPGQHATFRQRRDAPNEFMEGDAERLEYDGKSDVVRFVKNASVRVLRGSQTSNETTGNLITYDSATEVLSVSGGAPATPANPSGGVRAVLVPREGTAAAAEAASAAAAASASAPVLRTAPGLGKP